MSTVNGWKKDLEEETNLEWRHDDFEHAIKVSKFEDGTWDTWCEQRLVENYDTREEAVSRARKLMNSLANNNKGEKPGFGQS